MCGIATAGTLAGILITSTLSTALGISGTQSERKAQEAQFKYQQAVNEENMKIANENAANERQKGLEEARWQRIKTLQNIGQNKIDIASNGLDVGYGTNLDLIEDTSMLGELDALMIESEAEKRAKSYEISANKYLNSTNLNSYSNSLKNSTKLGSIKTTTSSLSGGLNKLFKII